jgi:serine/threonine protein kinase/tetratricopeptide (TPR) repeat protein
MTADPDQPVNGGGRGGNTRPAPESPSARDLATRPDGTVVDTRTPRTGSDDAASAAATADGRADCDPGATEPGRAPVPPHRAIPAGGTDVDDPARPGGLDAVDQIAPQPPERRYEMRSELGRGGAGVVALVFDRQLRRDVAMKVLRTDQVLRQSRLTRFIREAQITGRLEHPNIVPIHELSRTADGNPYFTMKAVRGKTLRERIEELMDAVDEDQGEGVFPLRERLEIFRKVLYAIEFAHAQGVVHRDLKPDNIMIGRFGEVQVMDWGIAKILPGRVSDPALAAVPDVPDDDSAVVAPALTDIFPGELTLDGQVMGTPNYMAPEQALGRIEEIDERTDIFALGAILYELVTLVWPYQGDSARDTLKQAAIGRIVPPGKRARDEFGGRLRPVPRELAGIIATAMQREPAARFQSIAGLRADLDAFTQFLPGRSWRDGPIRSTVKRARRHPAVMLILLVGLIAFGTISAVVARSAELEVRNARQKQELADLERRTAESEREKALEREKLREERLASLLKDEKIDELRAELGLGYQYSRDRALLEIERRMHRASVVGETIDEAIRAMEPQELRETYFAYRRLVDADTRGLVEVEADDLWRYAWLMWASTNQIVEIDDRFDKTDDVRHHAGAILRDAYARFPDSGNLRALLATYYRYLGEFERAYELMKGVVDSPDAGDVARGNAYTTMARIELEQNRDLDRALELMDAAITLMPFAWWARFQRAHVRFMLGDADGAIADIDVGVAQIPNADAEIWRMRGIANLIRGRFAEGEADLRKALEVAEPDTYVWETLMKLIGDSLQEQGKFAEAEAQYTQFLQLRGGDLEARYKRAMSRLSQGDFAGAKADVAFHLQHQKRDPLPWALLGDCEWGMDNFEAALAAYGEALQRGLEKSDPGAFERVVARTAECRERLGLPPADGAGQPDGDNG